MKIHKPKKSLGLKTINGFSRAKKALGLKTINGFARAKKALGQKTINGFARAKKALGQNFLKSEIALQKIIEAGEIKKDDVILEIGPGRGALTEKLLERTNCVIAVEKDRELFEFLKIKFKKDIENNTLILVCEDILQFNISETVSSFLNGLAGVGDPENRGPEKNLKPFRYKIIANIPYNITGAILKKFLTEKNQPKVMVLMVQHEVAMRILARDRKESLLSISVKAYGEPKMIAKVDKRYFKPAPKVNSAIISIKNISRRIFNSPLEEYPLGGGGRILPPRPDGHRVTPQEGNVNEEKFWEIVRVGFAHKRKKLSSNLKILLKNGSLASVLDLGNKRAEDLTLADWISLAKA